jgi:hypothetical protein
MAERPPVLEAEPEADASLQRPPPAAPPAPPAAGEEPPPPPRPPEPRPPSSYRPDLRPMLILLGLLVAVVVGWLLLGPLILPPAR